MKSIKKPTDKNATHACPRYILLKTKILASGRRIRGLDII